MLDAGTLYGWQVLRLRDMLRSDSLQLAKLEQAVPARVRPQPRRPRRGENRGRRTHVREAGRSPRDGCAACRQSAPGHLAHVEWQRPDDHAGGDGVEGHPHIGLHLLSLRKPASRRRNVCKCAWAVVEKKRGYSWCHAGTARRARSRSSAQAKKTM